MAPHGNRSLNRLTAAGLRARLRLPGLHADGGGLYLRVGKDIRHHSWISIYHLHGRRREIGLGSADIVTLSRAREKATEVRDLVDRGIDPIEARRATRGIPLFGEVADDWIKAQSPSVKSDKSIARWKRAVGANGYAQALRGKRVDAITTDDVLAVLKPIWHTKSTTARTVRNYVEAVLDAAKARKLRTGDNPAAWDGNLEPLLGSARKSSKGHAAIPWRELPSFMRTLRAKTTLASQALEFIILTAARTSEVLEASWQEFDLKRAIWTVPAARMKMGIEHTVPLSSRALEILAALGPDECQPKSVVFGGDKPLSNMTAAMTMRRMGRSETVHGTARSSFRDWAGSGTHYPRELAEEALAHAIGDATERAYRRETAVERRRPMMEDWAKYLSMCNEASDQNTESATRHEVTSIKPASRRSKKSSPLQTAMF